MRRARLVTLPTLAAIVVCGGIAHADPPTSDNSPAARRQKLLDQGSTDSSSTPNNSDSSPGPAATPAAPPPTPEELWMAALEPLPAGGWRYFTNSAPGSDAYVVYVSTHNVRVQGAVVTAWFRWEYMTAQTYAAYITYRSDVVRAEINCQTDALRDMAITLYSGNNLEGSTNSKVSDPGVVQWSPAVPGTIGESIVEWGCAQIRSRHR